MHPPIPLQPLWYLLESKHCVFLGLAYFLTIDELLIIVFYIMRSICTIFYVVCCIYVIYMCVCVYIDSIYTYYICNIFLTLLVYFDPVDNKGLWYVHSYWRKWNVWWCEKVNPLKVHICFFMTNSILQNVRYSYF